MRYRFVESQVGYSCGYCAKRNTPGCDKAKCGGDMKHRRTDGKNGHYVLADAKPALASLREIMTKVYPKDLKFAGWSYPTHAVWLTQPEVDMINKLKRGKK